MIKGGEYRKLDWPLIICFIALTLIGWVSIFSAVYDDEHSQIIDISQRYGMQFIWIITSYIIGFFILFVVNPKFFSAFSWIIYSGSILLLIAVIFLGIEVNGSNSWFQVGPVRFQPAELSKIATTLALASLMSNYGFRIKSAESIIKVAILILLPVGVIIMQKETGSALVYAAFILMLYREGLSGWYLTLGILAIALFLITLSFSSYVAFIVIVSLLIIARGFLTRKITSHSLFLVAFMPAMIYARELQNLSFISSKITLNEDYWLAMVVLPLFLYHIFTVVKQRVSALMYIAMCFLASIALIYSVEFIFERVLKDHQRARIENLLGINVDLKGAGYNVHQSKIAIGSGGFSGKGFLQGTQTKFNFVPEQSTDFIFCTIGEEWGFLGSSFLIFLFIFMIIRIYNLAEKQKDTFNRIYGYSLASILFMHFFINIGMTIGITPVIGIPLPFVSYGGSSLWSFTVFLFVFIRLDLDRWK